MESSSKKGLIGVGIAVVVVIGGVMAWNKYKAHPTVKSMIPRAFRGIAKDASSVARDWDATASLWDDENAEYERVSASNK